MGLGLRSLVNTSLMTMSSEVHGFLDYISEAEEEETKVLHLLASSNHPSLYWGHTEQNGDQNAILFGPLSLCNSNQWIGGNHNRQIIQFVNFHSNGLEAHWRLALVEFVGTPDNNQQFQANYEDDNCILETGCHCEGAEYSKRPVVQDQEHYPMQRK
jgi:hypothetical protein